MGKIKKILENELVGGTQSTDVYPITSTKAVYDENNKSLDNIIKDIYSSTLTVKDSSTESDLDISDEDGNVLVRCKNGHIQTKNFDSADIKSDTDIEIKDNYNSDLDISDNEGNVILRLKDGYIQTKNFDSRMVGGVELFTNKFKGKTLGIIGDSISTFRGWLPSDISGYDGATYSVYYPHSPLTLVTQTWWYKVAVALGMNPSTDISNCAWNGSKVTGDSTSTTNAVAGCSTRRISDLTLRLGGKAPDIIICYIGCNDWGENIGLGTWKTSDPIPAEGNITTMRAAYALMLYKLHVAYPDSRVFCCTNLDDTSRDKTSGWPSNNNNGISTDEWNANIIEIARAMGCDVINLHECGMNFANMSRYCVDAGLHPNDAGHTLMARKIVAELFAKY